MNNKTCKHGTIIRNGYKRQGYTRKAYHREDGTLVHKTHVHSARVPPVCIRATSQSGRKTSIYQRKILGQKKRIHTLAKKKFGTHRCHSGYILREGYKRHGYTRHKYTRRAYRRLTGTLVHSTKVPSARVPSIWVPPACIPSTTGRPHGQQLFVLEKGVLSKFGYTNINSLSINERHKALKHALEKINPLSLYRKLNALYVLNKNRDPSLSKKFREDAEWIKTTSEYKHRPTA